MIHHLKYSGFTELAPLLGELIVQRMERKMPAGDKVVVPVPLHKKREARRGYNQAELVARYVCSRLSLPGGNSLARQKNTETQVSLTRNERVSNLQGAFVCADQEFIRGKVVILIDDVTTTGTTLAECAKVLRESGARQVWGVVVAKRD
jgi:ComF family protein